MQDEDDTFISLGDALKKVLEELNQKRENQ